MIKFSDIKKKSFKDLLLELFVTEKYSNHTISQLKSKIGQIQMYFNFKVITSSDVLMRNGKIVEIKNLDKIDIFKNIKKKVIPVDKTKNTMYSFWNTYVNNFNAMNKKFTV